MKFFSDRKNWTLESVLDPKTGKHRNRYFFKGKRAQRIPITSRLAQQLAGYALIERDLRMVQEWLAKIDALSKDQIDQGKEGWRLTEKPDPDHNLTLGLFVAALTFYGKCFSECEGRKVKLDRNFVPNEFRETHDLVMRFRHNFAAHSGADKFENVQIVLVLNPKPKHLDERRALVRELIQPEVWVSLDPDEHSFSRLVERVRGSVLRKLDEVNDKIFIEDINPKGLDYWYSKKQY